MPGFVQACLFTVLAMAYIPSAARVQYEMGEGVRVMDVISLIGMISIFTAGITIGIGSLGCALGEGRAVASASRPSAMQGSERNIRDKIDELKTRYRQQRRAGITEEMLKVAAGFNPLKKR